MTTLSKEDLVLAAQACAGELTSIDFLKARVPQLGVDPQRLAFMALKQKLEVMAQELEEARAQEARDEEAARDQVKRRKRRK